MTMKGIAESFLDERNQTCSIVPLEDALLVDTEEIPDLIFDVSKEDHVAMHAKEPSWQDHLPAKLEGVPNQEVDGNAPL